MKALERILNALKESGCFVGDIDEAIAELKAKDERIKELNEAYAKSRSIVAMLFWRYKRNLFSSNVDASVILESMCIFRKAYKMLKDNA